MTAATVSLLDRLALPPTNRRAELARVWLEEHGLPTTRDEAWRYTPVDDIVRALSVATPALETSNGVSRAMVDDLAGDHGGPRLVFVNGGFDSGASDDGVAVDGLSLAN